MQYKNLSHQQLKFNNLFNLFKKRQLLHKLQSLHNNKLKVQHPTLNLLFSYRIDHQLQLNFQRQRKVKNELPGHQQLHRVVVVQLKRKFRGQSKKRLCLQLINQLPNQKNYSMLKHQKCQPQDQHQLVLHHYLDNLCHCKSNYQQLKQK